MSKQEQKITREDVQSCLVECLEFAPFLLNLGELRTAIQVSTNLPDKEEDLLVYVMRRQVVKLLEATFAQPELTTMILDQVTSYRGKKLGGDET